MRPALVGLCAWAIGVSLFRPPMVQAQSADEIVDVITTAAGTYGVSGARLLAVARCESRLNPSAVGRAGERGLFQLHPRGLLPDFYARGYSDPMNAWESADYAASAFARGLASHWTCARR